MSEKRHILYIHHERALGGAPLSLLYLLEQLDRSVYEPTIICLREGEAAELYRKKGYHVLIVSGPDLSHTELVWFRFWQLPRLIYRLLASFVLFFKLRGSIKSLPAIPALVHLNSSTLTVAAMAAKSLSLPVVWHIREPLCLGYFGFRRWLLRKCISQFADHVIAISKHDAEQLGTGIEQAKVSVIYNFIDFSTFDSQIPGGKIKKELGVTHSTYLILFLGGSAVVKGAYILLNASSRILENIPNSIIVIAGETDSTFTVEATQVLGDKRHRLHLLGTRTDIPELLADANVLLFPSTVPHFARPVIEAAAMGKPVVASNVGGVTELVVKNETGILVPSKDPMALSQAVIELSKDDALAFRLGQQALARAREKFDARRNSAETFDVYRKLIQS